MSMLPGNARDPFVRGIGVHILQLPVEPEDKVRGIIDQRPQLILVAPQLVRGLPQGRYVVPARERPITVPFRSLMGTALSGPRPSPPPVFQPSTPLRTCSRPGGGRGEWGTLFPAGSRRRRPEPAFDDVNAFARGVLFRNAGEPRHKGAYHADRPRKIGDKNAFRQVIEHDAQRPVPLLGLPRPGHRLFDRLPRAVFECPASA